MRAQAPSAKPVAAPPPAVGPLKDGWEEIDERLVFLTVELSSVEASIDAINKSIHASGFELSSKQDAAEHARKGNEMMDRNGGGPLSWSEFYGQTAARFYYQPTGEVVVNVAPQGRPPQIDYIYRANSKNQEKAEAEAAKLGNRINELRTRRRELEAEESALWCKISFRAVSSKELGEKPLYRFDLTTSGTDATSKAQVQAVTAGRDFLRTVLTATDVAQKGVDINQQQAFEQLQQTVTTARANFRDKLDNLPSLAIELVDSQSALGKLSKAAKRLDDSSQNIVDANKMANDDASADDEQRKTGFRGQLQRILMDFSETTVTADARLTEMASQWKVAPDLSRAVAVSTQPADIPDSNAAGQVTPESILIRLERAKSDYAQHRSAARKNLLAAIDTRIDSASDAGDLKLVESIKAARSPAETDGTIPDDVTDQSILSAKAKYDQDIRDADVQIAAAYKQAIRDLTKTRQIDQAETIQSEFDEKAKDWGIDPNAVAAPSVTTGTYLCDLVPFSVSTFSDGTWGFGNKGRIGAGDRVISVLGVASPHGLGTHPPSSGAAVIKYKLDGKYKRITGKVALDDAVGRGNTPLIFRIVGDERDIWRAQPIQASRHPQKFDVDVSGIKVLQLVVDCPGDHSNCQAVWIEPMLLP